VEPKGAATFLPLKSAGLRIIAEVRTVISSAGPMLSTRPTTWNGKALADAGRGADGAGGQADIAGARDDGGVDLGATAELGPVFEQVWRRRRR
jgi:hypothetical protein